MTSSPPLASPEEIKTWLAHWEPAIRALADSEIPSPKLPVHIFANEAFQYADHAEAHYHPRPAKDSLPPLPGLSDVSFRFPASAIAEIRQLAHLLSHHQALALFGLGPLAQERRVLLQRSHALLEEISDALEFLLDDDIQEPADADLAALQAKEAEAENSPAAQGQILLAYTLLAEELKARLVQDKTFDPLCLSEARAVAQKLIALSPLSAEESRPYLHTRNRLAALLAKRIATLRTAVKRVFKDHPSIRQLFTSSYQRDRRAQARASKKLPNPPAPPPAS